MLPSSLSRRLLSFLWADSPPPFLEHVTWLDFDKRPCCATGSLKFSVSSVTSDIVMWLFMQKFLQCCQLTSDSTCVQMTHMHFVFCQSRVLVKLVNTFADLRHRRTSRKWKLKRRRRQKASRRTTDLSLQNM